MHIPDATPEDLHTYSFRFQCHFTCSIPIKMENGDFAEEYHYGADEEESDLVYTFWEWVGTLKKKSMEGVYSSTEEEDENEGEGFSPSDGEVQQFSTEVFLRFKSELDNEEILEKINERFFKLETSPPNQIGQFTLVSADVTKVSELFFGEDEFDPESTNVLYGTDEESDEESDDE